MKRAFFLAAILVALLGASPAQGWYPNFAGGGGSDTFLDLLDTPASYGGAAGKVVSVKGTEDGLEFIVIAGTGTLTTVQIGDSSLDTDIGTLDFDATVFTGTEDPENEANIGLDLAPSSGSPTLIAAEDALQVKYLASDFDEGASGLAIDYTNGQAAASGVKGFLTGDDWDTFNAKEDDTHAGEHSLGGGDAITVTNLASGCTDAQVLGGDGAGTGVECQTDDDVPEAADYSNLTGGKGIGHAVAGTLTFAPTEMTGALNWNDDATDASQVWTIKLSGASDPAITFGNALVNISNGALQVAGSAVLTQVGDANIADGAVDGGTGGEIEDDTITAADLAAILTFADGDLVDLSGITHSAAADEGLILATWADVAPASDKPFIAWDPAGQDLKVYDGGWITIDPQAGSPTTAKYIVQDYDGTLSAERKVAEGYAIDVTDGGANSTMTWALDTTEVSADGTDTWSDGTQASVVWTFNLTAGDPALTFGNGVINVSSGALQVGGAGVYYAGGTDVPLADGGTGASLVDPNADRIFYWDDTAGTTDWLVADTNHFSIAADTLSIGSDTIDDTLVDWGSGAGQVDLDDVPNGSSYERVAAADVDANAHVNILYDSDATGAIQVTGLGATRAKTFSDAAATVMEEGQTHGGLTFGDTSPDAEGEMGYASNVVQVHDGTAPRTVSFLETAEIVSGAKTFSADVTLDDGVGASPGLVLKDATDETWTLSKADGGDLDISINNAADRTIDCANAGAGDCNLQVDGTMTAASYESPPTLDPFSYYNQTTAQDFWLGGYDTAVDRLEARTNATAGSNVVWYVDTAGLMYAAGDINIASGKVYKINGTQIDIGDLGAGGNWTPTGTLDLDSSTLQNVGHGTVVDGSNYTTISNSVDDDTIDELMAAIDTWAAGVSAGTLAALSDVAGVDYTAGTILIGDGADSMDQKAIGGQATLAANGTLTVVDFTLNTTADAGEQNIANIGILMADTLQPDSVANGSLVVQGGQTATNTLKLQAYDVGTGWDDVITLTSAADPTLALAADGGITIQAVTFAGGTNTFSLTNGTASMDVAAGATVNIDQSLTVDGQGTTITGAGQANTLTLNESLTVGDGNTGTLTYSAASKTLTVEDNATVSQDMTSDATVQFAGIELSHATENTLTAASGVLSIEGAALAKVASPQLTGDPTITDATPTLVFVDSTTSGEAGIVIADAAGPDATMDLQVDVGGTLTSFVQLDGVTETIVLQEKPIVLDDNDSISLDATADGMDDDEYNGITIRGRNCGENLTQWDTVRLANDTDPWHQADANAAGEFPAHGLSIAACTDTNPAIVLMRGIVRNEGWTGLTPGAAVYLSETAGGVTQTAPSDSGDAVQIVGWALSDSEIYFDFSRPYLEVE